MIKNKTFVLTILVFIATFIFYSWNIVPSYTFDNDSARDLVEIHEIVNGDMRLIGPSASFGGLKTGPYYYYLFVPVLLLTKGSVEGFLYFNAFVFACAISFFSFTLFKKFPVVSVFVTSTAIIVSPLFIFASRNPGNANTYLAFALVLFTLVFFYKLNRLNLAAIGVLTGVIVNFQYANILIFLPLSVYLFFKLQNKKTFLYYLVPFVASFAPLFLFEIRHDFVMVKNTLFTGSYKGFIENSQLGTAQVKRNLIEQIMFISYQIGGVIGISPLFSLPVIGLYLFKFQKEKRDLLFFIFVTSIYVFTLLTLQFQYADHYLYPAAISILFMMTVFLINQKQIVLLIFLIIFQLLLFPSIYANSERPYWFYKDVVAKSISAKIIKHPESFSIIQIRPETSITPHGYEYRYFFLQNGYRVQDIQNYDQSKQLIIYSRLKEFDLAALNSWEMQQFGNEFKKKSEKISINGVDVYSVVK
jgi:hypothetical protein